MLDKILANLSSRERTILIISVFVIFVVFSDRLILGPIMGQIQTLDSTIGEKEVLLKSNIRILSNRERILKEVEMYKKYPLEALSSEDELAAVLAQIEELADEDEVYLVDSSPSGTRREGLLKAYVVKVDCEGLMDQIVRFMHSIEKSKKLLRISNLRLRPKERGSDVLSCRMSVEKIVLADEQDEPEDIKKRR